MERKEKFIRNKEKSIQTVRFIVQTLFSLLCIWIGIDFHNFIKFIETNGAVGSGYRPPGVEGFLPISSLMSVYYFIQTGIVHSVHPAGFFIFLAIVGMSFLFRKSFCSWLCPVGFLSELVGDFGDKIAKKFFKKRIKVWKYLDYFLRSLKYFLLAFFAISIFSMSEIALAYFLGGDYNIMADVKMYYFFANISQTTIIVIGVLFFLSIIYRNFWCRYLCPYGALLGLLGFLSPTRIKRNADTCIDCGLCTKACPSFIKVDKINTVYSDECTSCLNCVDACPVDNTLELKFIASEKKINKKLVAIGVVIIFIALTGLGMLTDNWHNNVPNDIYFKLNKNVNSIGHPTSSEDIKKLNEESERKIK